MTKARIPLTVAALIAAFLVIQVIVGQLVNWVFLAFQSDSLLGPGMTPGVVVLAFVPGLLEIVIFAAGVYLSLRYVAPVSSAAGWKRAIVAGVIATLMGVAAVVVLGLIEAALGASNVSEYPFGYSFGYSLVPADLAAGIPQALESGLGPLINWLVPVVLATVLLKVWLGRQVAAVTAPASLFAKPSDR
jgi:hypothetical protein